MLWKCSQDAAADLPLLQSRGVTHVVNAAGASVPEVHGSSLSYLSLPLLDLPECVLSDAVIGAVGDFVEGALSSGGAVLIHCNAGVSRSSALAIAFLMTRRGAGYQEALSRVRAVRAAACPNEGFRRQLRDLELRLRPH
ncbi:skrp1 dual specificity protein phosphatase, putative [Ixodes scapularis]|uniref:Skrp1 dual specificity protein phosphatase, putative n=1 Tax=Ixodes scapularis TaxID=6945 RepID=B7P1J8_IXOSC|nr:skrp1 dual specificity protein phosphatase, putative [Ixodes scapularis]|eukprot:XP_002433406.1 skrp1 dual specificity protein phosphatase, putative [Ixodes scapularis]